MWSGGRSGQNLLRHRFHLLTTSPIDARQLISVLVRSCLAWVATEESATLPVGHTISHFPPKYVDPDSF